MESSDDSKWEPVDTVSLGRSTWTFLHTLAANYPKKPNEKEKTRMMLFMSYFSDIYPCDVCQSGLKSIVQKMPPEVESNHRFTQWMCRVHNEVNDYLGKDQFDCSKVNERWGVCESCKVYKDDLDAFKKLFKKRPPPPSNPAE